MKALVDNDIILKGARYALLKLLVADIPPADDVVGVLGAARYVLTNVLERQAVTDSAEVLQRVIAFIDTNKTLEPTPEEQSLAAEFESVAQIASLPLDTGESLLCAILIIRKLPSLWTGDKRAIESMERIIDLHHGMTGIIGKVKSAECLVLDVLTPTTVEQIRMSICGRPAVDKALYICCSCHSTTVDHAMVADNLNSYIRALRAAAPRVMCA